MFHQAAGNTHICSGQSVYLGFHLREASMCLSGEVIFFPLYSKFLAPVRSQLVSVFQFEKIDLNWNVLLGNQNLCRPNQHWVNMKTKQTLCA